MGAFNAAAVVAMFRRREGECEEGRSENGLESFKFLSVESPDSLLLFDLIPVFTQSFQQLEVPTSTAPLSKAVSLKLLSSAGKIFQVICKSGSVVCSTSGSSSSSSESSLPSCTYFKFTYLLASLLQMLLESVQRILRSA